MPKYSCLLYGEGGKDRKFIDALSSLDKFGYHASDWIFKPDNASGGHPSVVLARCVEAVAGRPYDMVVCFVDLDKLKEEATKANGGSKDWHVVKEDLEGKYPGIKIFWHEDNLEDEICKVFPELKGKGKSQINSHAKSNIEKFINSEYWGKLLAILEDKGKELDKQTETTI